MGNCEVLFVMLNADLSVWETANVIDRLKAVKGVEFIRTMEGIVQDILEANYSRNKGSS